MAVEFHHHPPAGGGAGEAQGGLDRLRAGGIEADPLGAGDHLADQPGRLELDIALATVKNSAGKLVFGGLADVGGGVAEDHRAHAEVVVDQPVGIDIEQIGAIGMVEHQRGRRNAQAKVAADAAREVGSRGGDAAAGFVEDARGGGGSVHGDLFLAGGQGWSAVVSTVNRDDAPDPFRSPARVS